MQSRAHKLSAMSDPMQLFQILGISLLLGLLVGLQREASHSPLAGIRTFPLITLLGTVCGLLAEVYGFWILLGGFLGIIVVTILGNVLHMKKEEVDPGMTTEVAILLMYAIGAYLTVGPIIVSVALGGAVAILLHLKPEMHGLATNLDRGDIKAIMQFVLITFIILPVLPNQSYGPLEVFNPYKTWLMVVLIVGISLSGYLSYKFFGKGAGTVLGGILGGMISSTATTVSYSRLARDSHSIAGLAAVVIMAASSMVYVRILVEIGVVAPAFFPRALPPFLIMAAVSIVLVLVMWRRVRDREISMPEQKNPSEMRIALTFGFFFVLVLFLVAAANEYFEDRALYLVAVVSGLADLDAITLSTAQLVESGRLGQDLGLRLILLAVISNFCFKAAMASLFGGRELLAHIALPFAVSATTGLLLILLW